MAWRGSTRPCHDGGVLQVGLRTTLWNGGGWDEGGKRKRDGRVEMEKGILIDKRTLSISDSIDKHIASFRKYACSV